MSDVVSYAVLLANIADNVSLFRHALCLILQLINSHNLWLQFVLIGWYAVSVFCCTLLCEISDQMTTVLEILLILLSFCRSCLYSNAEKLIMQSTFYRIVYLIMRSSSYTVRHKNTPNFFYHILNKSGPILISFGTNIPDTTGHQRTVYFSTSPIVCFCTTCERKRIKYCIFNHWYYCLIKKTHNTHTHFVHIFISLADNLSNCSFFNCLQKCLKCWPTNMGSARRHFLHLLIAASITFCSRPIQTSPIASWIHQHSWMLCLSNRCCLLYTSDAADE